MPSTCHGFSGVSGFARWPRGVGVQTVRAEARAAETSPACASARATEEKLGMRGWLRAVLLAAMLMVGTRALLVLLARRLPPGLLRDLGRHRARTV
jgi:hypothetical protein